MPDAMGLITAAVSVLAALSGTLLGWMARTREHNKAVREDAQYSTLLRSDIDYIRRAVDDIRIEQKAQDKRVAEHSDRLARVEESAKQAHKRLDRLEGIQT